MATKVQCPYCKGMNSFELEFVADSANATCKGCKAVLGIVQTDSGILVGVMYLPLRLEVCPDGA